MNHPDTTPHHRACHGCAVPVHEEEINWARPDGSLSVDDGDPYCDACLPPEGDTTPQVIRLGSTRCEWATVVEIDGGPSGQWCEITWSDDPFDMPTTIHPDERHGRDALAAAVALALSMADRVRVVPNLELAGVTP